MAKKKAPAPGVTTPPIPPPARIPVEIGTIDLYDLIALLNSGSLGASIPHATEIGQKEMFVLARQAVMALKYIGQDRWFALTQRLAAMASAALAANGVTHVTARPVTANIRTVPPDPTIN